MKILCKGRHTELANYVNIIGTAMGVSCIRQKEEDGPLREPVSLVFAKSWNFTVRQTKFVLYNGAGTRLR